MAEEEDSLERVFARNMKSLREHKGWSQNEFAHRVAERGFSWHAATVHLVEKGERKIPLNEAGAVAQVLGVPLAQMLATPAAIQALRVWEEAAAALRQSFRNLHQARDTFVSDQSILAAYLKHPQRVRIAARTLAAATRATELSPAEALNLDPSDDVAHWLLESNSGGRRRGEYPEAE